jgi:hypothetical protein
VVGKNSGDEAFGLITSDDRDLKGLVSIGQNAGSTGTSLTNGCSLTKAEINKMV